MNLLDTYVRVKRKLSNLVQSNGEIAVDPDIALSLAKIQGPAGVVGTSAYNPLTARDTSCFLQPILHELNSTFAPRGMILQLSAHKVDVTLLVFLPHNPTCAVQINGQTISGSVFSHNSNQLTYAAFYSDISCSPDACAAADAVLCLEAVVFDPVVETSKQEFSKFESRTDAFLYSTSPRQVILHNEASWSSSLANFVRLATAATATAGSVTLLLGKEDHHHHHHRSPFVAALAEQFVLTFRWVVLKQTKIGTHHDELSIHPFDDNETPANDDEESAALTLVGGSRSTDTPLLHSMASNSEYLPSEYLYGALVVTLQKRKKNLCSTTKT